MSIADIGREAAESSSGGGQTSTDNDYERIDVSEMSFVKAHPGPTAIQGTAVALRYFAPAPDDDGEYDDDARGWVGLILDDPSIPDDDDFGSVSIFENTSETGDDYKVVNTDHDTVDVYDVGVSVGKMFESEEVDEFPEGTYVLKLSTGAGRSVARTLDVRGLANADLLRTDDGAPEIQDHGYPEYNGALVEKFPGNDEETYKPPRYARDPQLRPDVEGSKVVVLLQHLAEIDEDYDGPSHWATILADVGEERAEELSGAYAEEPGFYGSGDPEAYIHDINGVEVIRLAPTMEFEPDEDLVRATRWLEWRWVGDDELETLCEEQGVDVD